MLSRGAAALLTFATSIPMSARSLPDECMNGLMEERQYLGLDPFAPPCDIVDPGPLPIYPILAAKNTVDALLAEEDSVRKLLRLGLPTGKLQLPPEINLSLFERISEALPAEAPALLAAAKAYTRDAYDCNELAEFCRRKKKDPWVGDGSGWAAS